MNSVFLIYSIWLILAILAIGLSIYFSIIKPIITKRDVLFLGIGMFFLVNSIGLGNTGREINEKLSIINIPKEIVSVGSAVNDSIINDKILYNYLLDIRSKHAKIILIQCKIESNNYKSSLFLLNNNLLGMKESSIRTSLNVGSRAGYQKYLNWMQSLQDYIMWGYSHNFDQLSENEYIDLLQKIYAEDPNYGIKIKKMLKEIDFKKLENN